MTESAGFKGTNHMMIGAAASPFNQNQLTDLKLASRNLHQQNTHNGQSAFSHNRKNTVPSLRLGASMVADNDDRMI